MKKKLLISLGLIAIIAASIAIGVYAASDIRLFINGKEINADIQTVNNSSYVPLRVVSDALGADIKWDGDKRTITITGKVPALPVDGVYKAGDLAFYDVTVTKDTYNWNVAAEVKNVGNRSLTAVITVVFYGEDGKRIGTAQGSVNGLDASDSKTVTFFATDDLTGYKTIKFQIDMSN